MTRRRWLAPEVVQTSEMDCGPACLKSLIGGFGVPVSYGRLREACQTDVDGTSVDTIEDVGTRLGLDCEQVLVPPDHVLGQGGEHLPCLAVVRLPDGAPHFVVLWRRHGSLVQAMDPAFGRRWIGRRRVDDELYVHEMKICASAWREWASSSAFTGPLLRRLRASGVRSAPRLLEDARADPSWLSLASLDAAARMVDDLSRSRAVSRRRATGLIESLLAEAAVAADPATVIPERWWTARAAPAAERGAPSLLVRGAVLVRARGCERSRVDAGSLSRELIAALDEPEPRPGSALLDAMRACGRVAPLFLAVGSGLGALLLLFESVLLRALLEVGRDLRLREQRLAALGALLVFMVALLVLEFPLAVMVQRLGRRIETHMRLAFLRKLPRIAAPYFRSRPASDMAERAHGAHRLREIVPLAAQAARALGEILAAGAGIVWLAPESAIPALGLTAACVLPPLLMRKPLVERDLRVRTHGGALCRFYLDALLGIVPVVVHGAERAMRREHEGLLVQWARAGRSAAAAAASFTALQGLLVHGFAVWLVLDHVARRPEPGSALLLVLWVMTLVWLAEPLCVAARAWPTLRNVTLRLLEPLGAPEESGASSTQEPGTASAGVAPRVADVRRAAGVRIDLERVTVHAAGHEVLSDVSLSIEPGRQVAIVGESGAGKSSLCGLLLGWHRPATGCVRINGAELCGERIEALRRETAWVDPDVQLWNRSLTENVRYGVREGGSFANVGLLCEQADLHSLLPRLSEGLQTPLGESGALVSGGEGQRVRLARALGREDARLAVLDEPFRGLDREQRRTLLERARRSFAGVTLLYVTHRIAESLDFERVLVVQGGHVVEDGCPERLARDESSHFRALLERERSCEAAWEDRRWRRLRLEGGRLEEQHSCARAG